MKTALISFRDVTKNYDPEAEKRLVWIFGAGGISVDYIEVFSRSDEQGFKKRFCDLTETADNVVLLTGGEVTFDVKEIICKQFGLQTEENANALKFIERFNAERGITGNTDYALLPEGSTVIPNFQGAFQGYTFDGEGCVVTVLPSAAEVFGPMCVNYVLPYFEKKYKIRYDNLTIKMFGVSDAALSRVLDKAKKIADGKISFNVERTNGDVKLAVVYDDKTPRMLSDDALRFIVSELQDKIYAEEDVTLGKRLFDMLNLSRKTLSVAESFTAGRVASAVITVPGASAVVNEGIVAYSNHAKMLRLGVKKETLDAKGAVSKETAYEMAAGLLKDEATDVVIATTGIAGPKSDGTDKPVGLCYISVGDREGVHIHKFNFKGDREAITETAKNTALFLAVKHIKKMF